MIAQIIFLICMLTLTSFYFHLIYMVSKKLDNVIKKVSSDDERVKNELSTYELERLEREEEFDERINRLKEELSNQQKIIRKGVSADELHPLVHNLPHDAIQTKYDVLPDVEVAD